VGGEWVYSYVVGASSGAQVALRLSMRSHIWCLCGRLCRSIDLVLFPLLFLMTVGLIVSESRMDRKHSTELQEPFRWLTPRFDFLFLAGASWPPNLRRDRRSDIHHGPTTLGKVKHCV
jgi:hypothetical protein